MWNVDLCSVRTCGLGSRRFSKYEYGVVDVCLGSCQWTTLGIHTACSPRLYDLLLPMARQWLLWCEQRFDKCFAFGSFCFWNSPLWNPKIPVLAMWRVHVEKWGTQVTAGLRFQTWYHTSCLSQTPAEAPDTAQRLAIPSLPCPSSQLTELRVNTEVVVLSPYLLGWLFT